MPVSDPSELVSVAPRSTIRPASFLFSGDDASRVSVPERSTAIWFSSATQSLLPVVLRSTVGTTLTLITDFFKLGGVDASYAIAV